MERLGSEKIIYNAERLVDIKEKGDTYPVHMAIGLTDYCNHKCIFCDTPVTWHYANSHYIKRSHSGLGIESKNIMTNCYKCHKLFEESKQREKMKEKAKNHFKEKYDNWKEEDLVYKKTNNIK